MIQVSGTKSELLQRLSREHDLNQDRSHSDDSNDEEPKSSVNSDHVYPDELQQLPKIIMEEFIKYTTKDGAVEPQLLPIQRKSFKHIANGGDTVLFSPTGTGKSLAYILPLAARLLEWKRDGSLASKKTRKRTPGNKNDSMSGQVEPATPSILVMEPSRELAKQVGKVWTRFHPTAAKNSKKHVVTVYGGVPMARHAAQLNSKTDVVIGTPGRVKELIREKYLSTENLKSIVLDEADTLLDFKDVPEVEWLLDGMQNDYQLVLASATINERVHIFVDEIMEISVGEEGYIVSNGVYEDKEQASYTKESSESEVSDDEQRALVSQPEVRHWSMAASASSRVALAADLILTIEPRRGIIFAASKAEVEVVAGQLSERLSADHSIHVLHGDMIQQARSRAVAAFKGEQTSDSPSSRMTRILVATDVASRGLDVPSCDLVIQLGVPRLSGKDGTFDSELYIHRSGKKVALKMIISVESYLIALCRSRWKIW
jgi:superfamily II DNA/RNA helicase